MDRRSNAFSSKFRILVVDDDFQIVSVIREILLNEGYDVETAKNGKEAMDLLMSGGHFDLVITDIRMPEMDGLELLRQTRRLKTYLPFITLTGYATTDEGMECVQAGVHNYLVKPFETKSLLRLVKEGLKTSFMSQLGLCEDTARVAHERRNESCQSSGF